MVADPVAWFLSATAFALSMSATPGPNNTMVTSSGATFGFARTVPHMLGVSIGFPVLLLCVALGAGALLRTIPALYEVLRWAGAAYLLWLAIRIATARPVLAQAVGRRSRPLTLLEAALFQWVNPKAWVIAAGAVATFTTPDGVLQETLLLAALFFVAAMLSLVFWTAAGVGAARVLRSGRALRAFNLVMAGLLVASLVPLIRGE